MIHLKATLIILGSPNYMYIYVCVRAILTAIFNIIFFIAGMFMEFKHDIYIQQFADSCGLRRLHFTQLFSSILYTSLYVCLHTTTLSILHLCFMHVYYYV